MESNGIYSYNPLSSLRNCPKCLTGQYDYDGQPDKLRCYDYFKCLKCKYVFKATKDSSAPINGPPSFPRC